MNRILDISEQVNFDDSIINVEYHSHTPYSSNTFNNSDEIRIPIHQQDIYTLPCQSFLIVEGKITKPDGNAEVTPSKLVRNAVAYMFEQIRYELCGIEIDRVTNCGITTTMKNTLTARPGEINILENAGWVADTVSPFSYCVPLKNLLGFADDYKKVLLNVKQELVLLRSASDNNSIIQTVAAGAVATAFKLTLTKIVWKMPYIKVEDDIKHSLLQLVSKDVPISIPFRRWQIHENPALIADKSQGWTVKTSNFLERPRYVIIGLQTNRRDNISANASHFDLCSIDNVKLYLNSIYYPYDNLLGNKALMYDMYSRFQSSYYHGYDDQPIMGKTDFLTKRPLIVVDCSKQLESMKTGSLDVRIELTTTAVIPPNTIAYCLIIHDVLMQYTPLSGLVKKIV